MSRRQNQQLSFNKKIEQNAQAFSSKWFKTCEQHGFSRSYKSDSV